MRMRKKIRKQRNLLILNLIFSILLLVFICFLMRENVNLTYEMESITSQKDQIIQVLENTITDLDAQIKAVSETNKSYVDELTELRSRSELYDKYSYAIINECDERTELKYEEIKLGEQLMVENGYDPNLMFGTIMVESGGNPNAVNTSSGATGYGQFMNSTAEFVWTDLLGYEWYDPEIMKDGESNITMMAEYYDYLYETKDGSTFAVIKQYSGNATDEGAAQYLARINSYTQKVGVTIQ